MNVNRIIPVVFYGDVGPRGYDITYLLMERRISHDFVIVDGDFLLSVQEIRDVQGYERIRRYLEEYQYIVDLWS